MLDQIVGVAGQHIVDGETTWKVPSWTLGALGTLRDVVFQKALRSTFIDGLPDAAQTLDRATLRRQYALGTTFEPYRLIFDGALDDDENLALFLHQLLLKHHPAMTEAATKELVDKKKYECLTAVLNANPRMPRLSEPKGAGENVEAATAPETVSHQPMSGQSSSVA